MNACKKLCGTRRSILLIAIKKPAQIFIYVVQRSSTYSTIQDNKSGQDHCCSGREVPSFTPNHYSTLFHKNEWHEGK